MIEQVDTLDFASPTECICPQVMHTREYTRTVGAKR